MSCSRAVLLCSVTSSPRLARRTASFHPSLQRSPYRLPALVCQFSVQCVYSLFVASAAVCVVCVQLSVRELVVSSSLTTSIVRAQPSSVSTTTASDTDMSRESSNPSYTTRVEERLSPRWLSDIRTSQHNHNQRTQLTAASQLTAADEGPVRLREAGYCGRACCAAECWQGVENVLSGGLSVDCCASVVLCCVVWSGIVRWWRTSSPWRASTAVSSCMRARRPL